MPYEICIESPWSRTLTGRHVPRVERRKTLEGAEKRARFWLAAIAGSAAPVSRTYLDRSDVLILDAGPQASAFIHKDA